MDNILMASISPEILYAMGVTLIVLEVFVFSFYLFFFGASLILTGALTAFGLTENTVQQLCAISVLIVLFLLLIRTRLVAYLTKGEEDINGDFLNEEGIGQVKNGKILYKATYWNFEPGKEVFKEGEKVLVTSAKNNTASIKKYKKV